MLMDVPDNSTPELFVLSQEEPALKNTSPDYERLDYRKLTLNGSEAYQLIYRHTLNGTQIGTIRTYIIGKDMADVMTFTSLGADFPRLQPLFSTILQSFHWLQK